MEAIEQQLAMCTLINGGLPYAHATVPTHFQLPTETHR